jgi:hypothetical protein
MYNGARYKRGWAPGAPLWLAFLRSHPCCTAAGLAELVQQAAGAARCMPAFYKACGWCAVTGGWAVARASASATMAVCTSIWLPFGSGSGSGPCTCCEPRADTVNSSSSCCQQCAAVQLCSCLIQPQSDVLSMDCSRTYCTDCTGIDMCRPQAFQVWSAWLGMARTPAAASCVTCIAPIPKRTSLPLIGSKYWSMQQQLRQHHWQQQLCSGIAGSLPRVGVHPAVHTPTQCRSCCECT